MRIPDELLKKWNDLRSHGDGKKIAESSGLTEKEISAAFNSQECTDHVFEAIATFFKAKEEKVKEYL